ncbi:alpha-amylase [Pyricularia oryzae 70-15]|uniref:Alpha-amylase n=1 Tax=Pyricularia oryzae (strain 70-15 / ATCC MYA-4617 / FGSC 8958) TaxID=242507 RepID=G4NL53_PYRO7|nr:alpha-amylase [Pyricularia oryzae 70-15]EHA46698.1 alpha-amylase [Pyricularia oryzae 70-15]KAI7916410.1 alpha-amylase [Pyricularia oryzae]KAI7917160.1 alpha-amylase [Pyricularia oryzae]
MHPPAPRNGHQPHHPNGDATSNGHPAPNMEQLYVVPDHGPCPPNRTLFEAFEWYLPAQHNHWRRLADRIPSLAALGVTDLWIPPACKGAWYTSNGYDVYDLYDLGEFDQRGARQTKWGSKEELLRLVDVANRHGVGVLFDAVLNHMTGADETERVLAVNVDTNDRRQEISTPHQIEAWTKFNFPGRGDTYSPLRWTAEHFTGVDYDQASKTNGIWKFLGKEWAPDVDGEFGNYDFLMCTDIDHSHPEVRRNFFHWVQWLASQMRLGGLRLDAVKHISASFMRDFVGLVQNTVGRDWLLLGEYWSGDVKALLGYLEQLDHRISLVDVPLVESFSRISRGEQPDLRRVFENTLAAIKPNNAVTFVVNHDTQTGQTLETPVEPFFIPIAYALILLRANHGTPCVFWCDLYGTLLPSRPGPAPLGGLLTARLMLARKLWAYGTEAAYFCGKGAETCVGFTRFGHPARSGGAGLAVVANTGFERAARRMCVGSRHAGERWTDLLRQVWGVVVVDAAGYAEFPVGPRGVSVWVHEMAEGRDVVEGLTSL